MTTWFVSRHRGAIEWARAAGVKVADRGIVSSLDIEQVKSGDLVVGTLPINLAAEVVRRGAHYEHLALDLPNEARGQELSADDMRRYGARLEHYRIELVGQAPHRNDWNGDVDYVMVVIASNQTLPNVLPILARDALPKALFVVVSNSAFSKKAAQTIANIAKLLEIPVFELNDAPTAPLSEVQMFAENQLKLIWQRYPSARVLLNATGGTKIMSNGFARAIGVAGEVIYCDTENDCIEYFAPQGRLPDKLQPDLTDLQTYFLAKGIEITECASASDEWMAKAISREKLTRYFVNQLSGKSAKNMENLVGHLNWISYLALPQQGGKSFEKRHGWLPVQKNIWYGPLAKKIEDAGLWKQLPTKKEVEFTNEDAARYLSGGWLEEFAALTMYQLKVDKKHWGVGVKIRPQEISAADAAQKELNELDLAVVWRNRLLVVECKTGQQVEGKESQGILNKLEAISSYAAGNFGEFWLASARIADANAQKRAREYRIKLYGREELALLPKLIANWMKVNTESDTNLLNHELEQISINRTR